MQSVIGRQSWRIKKVKLPLHIRLVKLSFPENVLMFSVSVWNFMFVKQICFLQCGCGAVRTGAVPRPLCSALL